MLEFDIDVLEQFDDPTGKTAGKYTKGLGQEQMGFVTDVEDINSMCLTGM